MTQQKKHFTMNTIKLNFMKKTSSMLCPVKRHLKYPVSSATEILSVSTIRKLSVEQGRLLTRA